MKKLNCYTSLFSLLLFISAEKISAQANCLSGNCETGIGSKVWESGDSYTGEFVGGTRNGYGEYVWADASFYFGHFVNSKLDGRGYYQSADGQTILTGIFSDGELREMQTIGFDDECVAGNCQYGTGIYFWATGDTYIGEWQNGSRTGYGRYDWNDGSFYFGYFKNDLFDGEGYFKSVEGEVMDGIFSEGKFQRSNSNSDSPKATPALPEK